MGGSVLAVRAAGRTRLGPAKGTGLARDDRKGSVRMLSPRVCSSTVECPIHVAFSASPSTRSGGGGKLRFFTRHGQRARFPSICHFSKSRKEPSPRWPSRT